MKLFYLLAILLVALCFWYIVPFVVFAVILGLGLAFGGILLAAAMHSGWKKMVGKS